jgi:hypothetical protein
VNTVFKLSVPAENFCFIMLRKLDCVDIETSYMAGANLRKLNATKTKLT